MRVTGEIKFGLRQGMVKGRSKHLLIQKLGEESIVGF